MQRVLRPGGTIIIIETLGTGATEPHRLADWLAEYYRVPGKRSGLSMRRGSAPIIKFDSLDQAAELISFFFGDELGETRSADNNWIILPECTGIWWKEVR